MKTAAAKTSTAYLLLVLTVLFWAGNWVIARGLQGHMSPIAMAFWRWLGAFAILLPFVAGPIAREWRTIARSWKVLAILGLLGVAAFNTLTYTGLKYTSATNGVLLNSVIPILIIAINVLLLERRGGAGRRGARRDLPAPHAAFRRGAGVDFSRRIADVVPLRGRGAHFFRTLHHVPRRSQAFPHSMMRT